MLNGPYAITIDGETATNFEMIEDEGGEMWLRLAYDQNTSEIAIIGTSVVPEFPISTALLLSSVLVIVLFMNRRGSFRQFKFGT